MCFDSKCSLSGLPWTSMGGTQNLKPKPISFVCEPKNHIGGVGGIAPAPDGPENRGDTTRYCLTTIPSLGRVS